MKKKYAVGLIIGRFQPFHNGHLYLLREALKIADKIIIGIGSSNIIDTDNPWTFEERKKIVEEVLKIENLQDLVIKIIDIRDVPDDSEWLEIANERAGKCNVIIGNNEWVNGIYEKSGTPAVRINLFKRFLHEGTKIRKLMRENKKWEDRVPVYVARQLSKNTL
jgi:nicotinamide-nucleotide adenylyltransferase